MLFHEVVAEIGVDEILDVAIHDGLDIRFGIVCAQVLDQSIGAEDIGTDLAGEGNVLLHAADLVHLFLSLLLFELEELGAEHVHGHLLVLHLAPLHGHDDPRRLVRDPHRRLRLVHVLASRPGGVVGVDGKVGGIDIDCDGIVELRHDVDGSEGSMPAAGGVEGRETDETMDAVFRTKVSIGVLSRDEQRGRADARLVAFQDVQKFAGKSRDFRIALIHSQKHARPIVGFRSAGSRMEFQNGVVLVVGATIKEGLLELRHFLGKLSQGDFAFLVDVWIVLFLEKFQIFFDSLKLLYEGVFLVDLFVDFAQLAVDLLGLEGILPEAGIGCLCAELFAFLLELVEVKDSLANPEAVLPGPCSGPRVPKVLSSLGSPFFLGTPILSNRNKKGREKARRR